MIAPIRRVRDSGAVVWYQGESDVLLRHELLQRDAAGPAGRVASSIPASGPAGARRAAPWLWPAVRRNPTAYTWANLREAQRQVAAPDPHAPSRSLWISATSGPASDQQARSSVRRLALAARNRLTANAFRPPDQCAIAWRRGLRPPSSPFAMSPARCPVASLSQPASSCAAPVSRHVGLADMRMKNGTVVLPGAGSATRVRYCWADTPACPLSDGSGRPAGPFEMAIR